jgi:uncharacterized protein YxjI
MNQNLNRNLFFVKEHTGIFKSANNFDIHDPETREIIMECREPNLGFFTKMFRFTKYKTNTPFEVVISANGSKLITIKRGVSIFLSTVQVFDENDALIGKFKQKFFSIGGKFDVLDANEQVMCSLKGTWTGWEFSFAKDNVEFAKVTKKWAGIGKEFFTTADNYVLSINDSVPANHPIRPLIIAAVMCIDMVLKER